MLKIETVASKKTWESFLSAQEVQFYPFFQSWNWGEAQRQMAHSIWRIGVYDDTKLIALCQIVKIAAKRGTYLHFRHGPVLLPFDWEVFDAIVDYGKKLASEERAWFLRMSPVVPKQYIDFPMLKKRGFRNAPMHNMDAEICWVLDITKPEDQLLKEMRKTHRYLIRKAESLDIEIIRTKKVSDINDFLNLYSSLSARKHFVAHKGLLEEFDEFGKDDQEILFLAKYQGKIISGALIAFVGNNAIYRHGASDNEYRDIPASYLLQWEAIKEAKKMGKTLYNFWGIAPPETKNHPWQGLTLFKTGFGGRKIEFLHAQDLPLNFSYWKTYLIERIVKWKKGY